MAKIPVTSSNISAVEYDNGQLIIDFVGGSRYAFVNFPDSLWQNFLSSNSKGRFFHANIKGQFHATRIEEKED
jgi:hypothetical protein